MLVLVLLPILIDYFNDGVHACSLGIAGQIKIMEEPSLVFTGFMVQINNTSTLTIVNNIDLFVLSSIDLSRY
jgi:hypothetical protein